MTNVYLSNEDKTDSCAQCIYTLAVFVYIFARGIIQSACMDNNITVLLQGSEQTHKR